MSRPLIYISGPITNGGVASQREIENHVRNAQSVAVDLIAAGFTVYCPHSSGRWEREREIAYDDWLTHDFAVLDRCDAVYRLPGESRGADAEVEYAKGKAIPVFYAGEQTYERLRQLAGMAMLERELDGLDPEPPPTAPPAVLPVDGIVKYSSGAIRSSDREQYRYDLIAPEGLRRLAMTCAEGAAKYGDRNWEKGMPASVFINHAMAHIAGWLDGDASEDHLAHATWNLIAVMHFQRHGPKWIDCGPTKTGVRPQMAQRPHIPEEWDKVLTEIGNSLTQRLAEEAVA